MALLLPADYRDRLLQALKDRGVRSECELCAKNTWSFVDQPIALFITDPDGAFRIPMPQIPTGALICNNCGNVRTFALAALGLLSPPKTEDVK
jgi:hypothetical protein